MRAERDHDIKLAGRFANGGDNCRFPLKGLNSAEYVEVSLPTRIEGPFARPLGRRGELNFDNSLPTLNWYDDANQFLGEEHLVTAEIWNREGIILLEGDRAHCLVLGYGTDGLQKLGALAGPSKGVRGSRPGAKPRPSKTP